MIYGVVAFLLVIGILVFVSTIGSKNDFIDDDKMNEDIEEKSSNGDIIDFRDSDSIPNDLRKLKEKINKEQDSYKVSQKMIITLSVLVVIIITGIFIILPIYVRNANDNLNHSNSNEIKNDIYEEIEIQIINNGDNNSLDLNEDAQNNQTNQVNEIINYEKLDTKEKTLYKDAVLGEELVNAETIVKNFSYAESINNTTTQFILVNKDKEVLKFNSSSDIEKYLSDVTYLYAVYEKRFVLKDNGLVEKYIYTYIK